MSFFCSLDLQVYWIIVSVPVHTAGKTVTRGDSVFRDAILTTLLEPTVYALPLVIVELLASQFVMGFCFLGIDFSVCILGLGVQNQLSCRLV